MTHIYIFTLCYIGGGTLLEESNIRIPASGYNEALAQAREEFMNRHRKELPEDLEKEAIDVKYWDFD
jgi:hypothetical protein